MVRTILLLGLAILLNAGTGFAAWSRRSVTAGGAVAGTLTGTVILVGGGFVYWIMLMLFFVSSSLASKMGRRRKRDLARIHEKGSQRDAVQVFANGGVAAVAVVLLRSTGNPAYGIAAAAAFAGVNADTWASELGVLSAGKPRSIVTGRELEPGTSGGVSLPGTLFAAAGSVLIAAWYAIAHAVLGLSAPGGHPGVAAAFIIVLVAGLLGTTTDSILGATAQAHYRAEDGSTTERRTGPAGPHERIRGLVFITNDAVNFLSSLVAAGIAGATAALVGV